MENNFFVTETDEKYGMSYFNKSVLVTFAIFSVFSCLGFIVSWETFAFLECAVAVGCLFVYFQNKQKGYKWKLEFKNSVLTITNLMTYESFSVYAVPASDFVVKQSKKEMQSDYCRLRIKHTIFSFSGIKNCQQLKEYIQENYK